MTGEAPIETVEMHTGGEPTRIVIDEYESGNVDRVFLLYPRFVTTTFK